MSRNLLIKVLLFYTTAVPDHRGKWKLIKWCIDNCGLTLEGSFIEKRSGSTWHLTPSDYAHQDLFWYGVKDKWEVHHAYRYVSDDAVFIDIGANFGYYSVQMAKRMRQKGRVYAFEPNPTTCALLKYNLSLNELKNVEPIECALGDQEGSASLSCRSDNSGAAAVIQGFGIKVTTLDDFAATRSLDRLDFIKIDVEGFEEKMLNGAARTLQRFHPTILIELNPPTLHKNGSSPKRVVDLLRTLGYDIFEIHRKHLTPLSALPSGVDYVNVIASFPRR